MPKKSKVYKPRKYKKRIYRRRRRFQLYKQPNKLGLHWFKRTVNSIADVGFQVDGTMAIKGTNHLELSNTMAAVGTTVYGNMSYIFSIQNLPQVSEFTNLFDDYQIRKIVFKIIP